MLQWNLSLTTTSMINFNSCNLSSNVFNDDWRYIFTRVYNVCILDLDELQKAEKYPIRWSLKTGFTVIEQSDWLSVMCVCISDYASSLSKRIFIIKAKSMPSIYVLLQETNCRILLMSWQKMLSKNSYVGNESNQSTLSIVVRTLHCRKIAFFLSLLDLLNGLWVSCEM